MKPEITPGYPYGEYKVRKDPLSKEEQKVYEAFIDLIFGRIGLDHFCKSSGFTESDSLESFIASRDKTLIGKPISRNDYEQFAENLIPFVTKFGVDGKKVSGVIAEAVHGYKTLQPLMNDEELEEIIVNGINTPIYVVHRSAGVCQTNLMLKTDHELRVLISQLGADETKPFDDLRLPDGCRANITFEPVAEKTAVTIRKFRYKPMSIVDLMKNGTLDADLAAFLWLSVEGMALFPLNLMIVGGTASGKTTTLNALAALVPPHERIITIEDTREINLFARENTVHLETTEKADLEALVKNSLRMRPDRIIVGEIRGSEAEDLFTAMNVGHRGTLATLHANSDRDAIKRLENAPMRVPRGMLPLIDVIVVQNRIRDSKSGRFVRRIMQVSEVSRLEDEIALNETYNWDIESASLKPTKIANQSREKLAKATGNSIKQVTEELERRKKMLDYLLEKNICEYEEVCKFMKTYYEETMPKPH